MSEVITDTSALIAFFVKSEKNHPVAKGFMLQNKNMRWLIPESVFDETVTWIRRKISIKSSIQIGKILRDEHHYINLSEEDDAETWKIFCQYDDKQWSYTDCSLIAIARRLSRNKIFAFDEHIRQMSGLGIVSVP